MAAALSDEEFQRMQGQLLDLRSKNYTLGEKNVKIQTELLNSNHLIDDLKKELAKCQKIINRSKNAREVDLLIQENDSLQQKLQMQEDEFRLQNETLMKEISDLVASNDNLTKSLEWTKTQSLTSTEFQIEDDKIKLEAENVALKKLISNYEKEVNANSNPNPSSTVEYNLELNIIREEKRLLQESLNKIESEYKTQLLKVHGDNEKLCEKLKKKQESFLILQDEKEKLYSENKRTLENFQASKDAEIVQLKNEVQNVQLELQRALLFSESDGKLEKDMDATVELNGDRATFDYSLNETKLSLVTIQDKIQSLTAQLSESNGKVELLETANGELVSTVKNLESDLSKSAEALEEKTKLAEKRKKMMEDMRDHLKEATDKQSNEIENLTRKLAEEQEAFENLFDKEKQAQVKLVEAKSELAALKDELEKLRTARYGADEKIQELEAKIKSDFVEHEKSIEDHNEKHTSELERLREHFESDIRDLNIQLEVSKAEKAEFEDKVKALQQDAKDSVDDRKIQEKKGLAMVKDLKRQLQAERNRAEKLQDRLQEVLNEHNKSVDEILQSTGGFDKQKGDASSISSWSYVSGGTTERDNHKDVTLHSDGSSAGHDSPARASPTLLESETTSLLAKVAQLQQKNWTLEEKVNHLEVGNEGLADDVLKKTAIIQFYCMERRADPHASGSQDKLTLKRVVDFIKDRGDENLKEINRRMQRMLEETLTKNMHLQKDIETLSNEVTRLSNDVPS